MSYELMDEFIGMRLEGTDRVFRRPIEIRRNWIEGKYIHIYIRLSRRELGRDYATIKTEESEDGIRLLLKQLVDYETLDQDLSERIFIHYTILEDPIVTCDPQEHILTLSGYIT